MDRGFGFVWSVLTLCIAVYLGYVIVGTVTDPTYQSNYSARYQAYQAGETARYQAQQQTQREQAAQWGATLRTWGNNAAAAGSILVVTAGAAGVLVVWQRERTKRHVVSAQAQICLAYIGAFGGRVGMLGGTEGVYLDDPDGGGEFVPWHVARRELAAARLLVDSTARR